MDSLFRLIVVTTLLLVLNIDLMDAFSTFAPAITTKKKPYLQIVTEWLDKEDISWKLQQQQQDDAKSKSSASLLFPRGMTSQPVLEVSRRNNINQDQASAGAAIICYLHLLESPNAPSSSSECVSPLCTRDMTNYVQYINTCNINNAATDVNIMNNHKISLIHLHEDVWHSKTSIVQNRLRNRFGIINNNIQINSNDGNDGHSSRLVPTRIYARKTKSRRIDAGTAIPFLQEHHLWSATKARYYYGLFLKEDEDVLVAVATFSTKRNLHRGNQEVPSRSHELIRFCTRVDGNVVGGITKLIRAFINDQTLQVDDIVTVVDRDWGPGDGWHSIGFETLHVMAPVLMVIKDGIRHHLVGAGIKNDIHQNEMGRPSPSGKITTGNESVGRPGVESHVLEELADLATHQEALQCLEKHGYFPVYDAGVERLLMVVPKKQSGGSSTASSESESNPSSIIPSYSASYNSKNSGISALLDHVMALTGSSTYGRPLSDKTTSKAGGTATTSNDSIAAQRHTAAWKATGGTARNATLLYTAPSSMDPRATVEVRERPGGGWCTLGIVGGATKSIYHGNFKLVDEGNTSCCDDNMRLIDSSVMVSEYLRTMAAVALAGLEFQKAHPDSSADDDGGNNKSNNKKLSFLYLGYGAGSLPRFMASTISGSRHVAIEIDDGVVSAAHHCQLLRHSSSDEESQVQLQLDDALTYGGRSTNEATHHDNNKSSNNNDPFDVVFVDIFDGDNLLPEEFYSNAYLHHIHQNHLGGSSVGMVIHNFHTGGKARGSRLQNAIKAYRSVFSTTLAVESVDSRSTGGNTVLLSMNRRRLDASSETLSWHMAANRAQQCRGIDFDVMVRATNKLWFS